MFEDDFWLADAVSFRRRAVAVRAAEQRDALIARANVCLAVARQAEEHAPGG